MKSRHWVYRKSLMTRRRSYCQTLCLAHSFATCLSPYANTTRAITKGRGPLELLSFAQEMNFEFTD